MKASRHIPVRSTAKGASHDVPSHPKVSPRQLTIIRHRSASNFLQSPARDSSAARTILKKLLDNGYGIEHFEAAYRGAWMVKTCDPKCYNVTLNRTPITEDNDLSVRGREAARNFILGQNSTARFPVDETLLLELIEIRPKVPYLPPNYGPPSGISEAELAEPYTTQTVLDYMSRTPINEPENDRGQFITPEAWDEMERKVRERRVRLKVADRSEGQLMELK
ncbi:MAG TPA: hypothetical protein P5186_29580, partial [Candidatus Paceibacterota bacterium]|nr:hypothetical protein [Candidatus Paceibacterota bacterium]